MGFLKVKSLFAWRASFDVTVVTKQYCLYPQRWWIVFSVGLLLFTRTFHFMSYPSVSKVLAPFYDKVTMVKMNPCPCYKVCKKHFFQNEMEIDLLTTVSMICHLISMIVVIPLRFV